MRLRKNLPNLPPGQIPAGTIMQTEKGYFFVHANGRYRFTSDRAVESWSPQRILRASESDEAVSKLKVTAKMKFRNGSLIWNLSDARLYLIESGKRRWVKSPDAFIRIGVEYPRKHSLFPKGVFVVSLDEVELHEPGEDLI